MTLREEIRQYVGNEYKTISEHPWASDPNSEVLRHASEPGKKKAKWYGLMMEVSCHTLGLPGDGKKDILNIKCDPDTIEILRMADGYLPAYHMNKRQWITILLDGSVPMESIIQLLDKSYLLTASRQMKKKSTRIGPRDWLVPANPKYYDVIGAFEKNEIIDWKQSSDVRVGDHVYLYVAAPYSAILYHCKALEVDIPCNYESKHLTVKKMMKIQMLHQYDKTFMPFTRMKDEYGIYAVRGPRSIPNSLKEELER